MSKITPDEAATIKREAEEAIAKIVQDVHAKGIQIGTVYTSWRYIKQRGEPTQAILSSVDVTASVPLGISDDPHLWRNVAKMITVDAQFDGSTVYL